MKFEIEIPDLEFMKLKNFVKDLEEGQSYIYPEKSETPAETIKQLFFLDFAIVCEPTTKTIDLRKKVNVKQLS